MISAVNPASGRVGGLADGYRLVQGGPPTGAPGSLPPFRGVANNPGSAIGAPEILSSAARNNRGSNVQIPYARVRRPAEAPARAHRPARSTAPRRCAPPPSSPTWDASSMETQFSCRSTASP